LLTFCLLQILYVVIYDLNRVSVLYRGAYFIMSGRSIDDEIASVSFLAVMCTSLGIWAGRDFIRKPSALDGGLACICLCGTSAFIYGAFDLYRLKQRSARHTPNIAVPNAAAYPDQGS
jgi:hypothetical protein